MKQKKRDWVRIHNKIKSCFVHDISENQITECPLLEIDIDVKPGFHEIR